jgi:hypothetical protein
MEGTDAMKERSLPQGEFIKLQRNPEIPHVYDVDLENLDELRNYDSLEIHFVLYPFSRRMTSRHIAFNPFEEYFKDISTHQRSAYTRRPDSASYLFGLFLGLVVALMASIFKPWALFSIEAIAAFFGVYMIGKQLWHDIEVMLFNLMRDRKLCYLEKYYRYQLEKNTTLTKYSTFAKKARYGKPLVLPDKIDYIRKSTSLTLRMHFSSTNIESFDRSTAHIISIHVDERFGKEFVEKGYMFGVKLRVNQNRFGFQESSEIFQSIVRENLGCLDANGDWVKGASYHRDVVRIGRFHYYRKESLLENRSIIVMD